MDNHTTKIPTAVYDAFPVLKSGEYIRLFASATPLVPDTTFTIFATNSGDFFAVVITDHADPQAQSIELKNISGQNRFELLNLIKPHGKNNDTVEILEYDDMKGDFCIVLPYKNYQLYCYVANIKVRAAKLD